ncbi:MmgE/PrpD family protein [Acuticoccus sediminis]|uniref:MmgE/PrpD family protein n=1 Tax=Acuticoccus sediminis TaxID=2184697 RepID=UPI001CFEFAAD|nr:MmgE/PrpD family protein [Acuticoccus sediminis]
MSDTENPLPWLTDRVVGTSYGDLTPASIEKAKTFLLDTFGVGVAGCHGYRIDRIVKVASGWGAGEEARVWVSGETLPAGGAAFVNAYQIHSLEYDCVNEDAVLHPMATLLSAVMGYCERRSRQGRPVNGRDFLAAVVMGVDVSIFLGKASTGPIRFFRPAAAGGFGAAAALAKLEGFDATRMTQTLGNQYGQSCGTLQPHVEGSPMLGMQVGFNARAALAAADFAAEGVLGPEDVLTGRYGYFRLFENDDFDVAHGKAELEAAFQMERMSHKPYPSGRLTHGVVDGLGRLIAAHGFAPDDIATITATVPQLVHRLVGRPDIPEPAPNYAKLCLPFVAGTFLNHGVVDVDEFIGPEKLNDPRTHDFAARVTVIQDDNPSHSAMTPQTIAVTLKNGASHSVVLEAVYGHADNPLSREENLDKFRRCWSRVPQLAPEKGEELIGVVDAFETLDDVADVVRYLVA